MEDLNNGCAVYSPVSLMNSHLKTIFWVELYWPTEFCAGASQQHPCRFSYQYHHWMTSHSRHLLSKTIQPQRALSQETWIAISVTIFWVELYWLKWSVSKKTWTMNMWSLASVTDEQSFHEHLLGRTLTDLSFIQGDLTSDCAEPLTPVSPWSGLPFQDTS